MFCRQGACHGGRPNRPVAIGSIYSTAARVYRISGGNVLGDGFSAATTILYLRLQLTPSKMGWMQFIHYVSPNAYCFRGLAQVRQVTRRRECFYT